MDCAPHFEVDLEIAVRNSISHPVDQVPLNLRMIDRELRIGGPTIASKMC